MKNLKKDNWLIKDTIPHGCKSNAEVAKRLKIILKEKNIKILKEETKGRGKNKEFRFTLGGLNE